MLRLEKTSAALYYLMGDNTRQFGQHLRTDIVVGQPGINVGETMFDPTLYDSSAINPLAITPMLLGTDMPYADLRVPYAPVELNVVVEDNSGSRMKHEWIEPIVECKRTIGTELVRLIEDAKQPADSVKLHVVGAPSDLSAYGRHDVTVIETNTSEESTRAVAEICRKGISFIISNFERLPLDEMKDINFRNIVGIKVNHPLEIAYPANTGVWTLSGLKEVNTNNPKKLDEINEKLMAKHLDIVRRLGSKSVRMAKVVYDDSYRSGLNVAEIDRELSSAVLELSCT
jgi:hypothetical protein